MTRDDTISTELPVGLFQNSSATQFLEIDTYGNAIYTASKDKSSYSQYVDREFAFRCLKEWIES